MERTPPYNAQAEIAVLGSVLLNNDVLPLVCGILQPEHFYVVAHRLIMRAIIETKDQGKAVDHVTLGATLRNNDTMDKVGGEMGLSSLTDAVATTTNAEHYAIIVRENAAVRKMINCAQEISALGYSRVDDTELFLAESRKMVTEAAADLVTGGGPQTMDKDLGRVYMDVSEGRRPDGLVSTGMEGVDAITGGLFPGVMTVVGARPSMGKSVFGSNIAINAALRRVKTLYIDIEDTKENFIKRQFARFASIDLIEIVMSNLTGDKAEKTSKMVDAIPRLSDLPFHIENTTGLNSDNIWQICATHKERHGLDLVVIDHLGELKDKGENATQEITKACRGVRDVFKELKVPGMLLHQLNRGVEGRSNKRPTLADLYQSGQIEAIARNVWFLYRDDYYQKNRPPNYSIELIVAKANHGRTGMVRLRGDLKYMFVRSWDETNDGPWPGEDQVDKDDVGQDYNQVPKEPREEWQSKF